MTPFAIVGAVCQAHRRPLTWKLALIVNGIVAAWFLSIGVASATHRWLRAVPAAASEIDFTLVHVLVGMAALAVAGMLLRRRSRFLYGMILSRSIQDR
jgi:hypothetical protein